MSNNSTRATLVSSGIHLGAVRRLGSSSYDVDEYLAAVEAARDAGDGEQYADRVLGIDVDAIITGTEQDSGEETVRAAERLLRSRSIDPKKASYRQFAAALVEVSR